MGLGIPKQQHIRMQLKFFKHFLSLENITKKYLKFILRQSLFCHPAVCFTSTTQSSFYCFCVNFELKCHLHQASAHAHMHALCGDKKEKTRKSFELVFVISKSDSIHFFHFVRDSCKSHNRFNQQQAKLASAGMLRSLWFWFSGLYRAAKNHLF